MRDGDGMTVELVKSETLGTERVERRTDVRSVSIPSSQGMVRLDDVVEILVDEDDVHPAAIERVVEQVDDDPSTGGHIDICSPSSSYHTASFERVDIFASKVDNARGSATCGPDETWLNVVIPKELDSRMFDAVNYHALPDDVYNRSTLVEHAVEELLDDTDPVDEADDDDLVAELEQRGYDCVLQAEADEPPTVEELREVETHLLVDALERRAFFEFDDEYVDRVLDGLRDFFAQGITPNWLEDLVDYVDAFELEHVEALEEFTDIPGSDQPGADVEMLRHHVVEEPNDGYVRRAFELYHKLPVSDGDEQGGDRREKALPKDGDPGVDVCPKCEGHGGVVGDVCPKCEGTGRLEGGDDGAE